MQFKRQLTCKRSYSVKKIITSLLCSILYSGFVTAGMFMPNASMHPQQSIFPHNMTEAELQALDEEIKRMSPEEQQAFFQITDQIKEIDNAVQKMSPEEQQVFYQTLDKLSQLPESELERMVNGQMSEEEMEALFNSLLADQMPGQTEAAAPETETPKDVPISKPLTSEQEAAVALLDSLIIVTDSILLKCNTIPEISGKIASWSRKGQLTTWQTTSWNTIRGKIEQFTHKIKSLKEFDAKKNRYKFIQLLVDNETLMDRLKSAHNLLKTTDAAIDITPFGLGKISSASKNALIKSLNKYGELINKTVIFDDIDAILNKDAKVSDKKESQKAPAAKEDIAIVPDIIDLEARNKSNNRSNGAHADIDALLTQLEQHLADAAQAINKSSSLKQMKAYLTSNDPIDIATATDYLPEAIRKINGRTNSALETIKTARIKISALTGESKKEYEHKIAAIVNTHASTFAIIEQQVALLKSDWKSIEQSISADKKYAYIGQRGMNMLDTTQISKEIIPSDDIRKKVAYPSSYMQLSDGIAQLKQHVTV